MAMKDYYTLPKALGPDPHHQIVSVKPRTLIEAILTSRQLESVYYTSQTTLRSQKVILVYIRTLMHVFRSIFSCKRQRNRMLLKYISTEDQIFSEKYAFTHTSARAGCDTRSFFKLNLTGLNSVFFLLRPAAMPNVKESSLPGMFNAKDNRLTRMNLCSLTKKSYSVCTVRPLRYYSF